MTSAAHWHRFLDGDKDQIRYERDGEAKAEQHEYLVELIHCRRRCWSGCA